MTSNSERNVIPSWLIIAIVSGFGTVLTAAFAEQRTQIRDLQTQVMVMSNQIGRLQATDDMSVADRSLIHLGLQAVTDRQFRVVAALARLDPKAAAAILDWDAGRGK